MLAAADAKAPLQVHARAERLFATAGSSVDLGMDYSLAIGAMRVAGDPDRAWGLAREGLARREVQPSSLAPARAALTRAANATRPRADIRLWLEQAVQLLSAIGVP